MTSNCCFCKTEQEVTEEMPVPVVCDKPECLAKALEWGWSQLLSTYVDVMPMEDGSFIYRFKPQTTDANNKGQRS